MFELSWNDVRLRAVRMLGEIEGATDLNTQGFLNVYPIPNGGVYAAMALAEAAQGHPDSPDIRLVEDSTKADILVDDLLDSGETKRQAIAQVGSLYRNRFFVLLDKQKEQITEWVRFPWERMNKSETIETNVARLIQYIGDDPTRSGLLETPSRVIKSYAELFAGYNQDASAVLKTFDEPCDEMVVLRGIEFYSTCEHHMLPFSGTAYIGYIPDGRVVGISKLARLLEVFSRRLQIQERICQQVTSALDDVLKPLGSACILIAKHHCMTCRGVNKQHADMVTSSLTGVFRDGAVRQEFLSMVKW